MFESRLDAYISRCGDFCANNINNYDRTDYFTLMLAYVRGVTIHEMGLPPLVRTYEAVPRVSQELLCYVYKVFFPSHTINSILKTGQPEWSKSIRWHEILVCSCAAVMATVKALGDPLQGHDTDLIRKMGVDLSNNHFICYHVQGEERGRKGGRERDGGRSERDCMHRTPINGCLKYSRLIFIETTCLAADTPLSVRAHLWNCSYINIESNITH